MDLLSRAFDGVPMALETSLSASEALARLQALKRWAPGKPLLTGTVEAGRVALTFAPGSGHGRAPARFEGVLDDSSGRCGLRGRFASPGGVRASSALLLAVCALMAFGGLTTGLAHLGIGSEPLAQVGLHLLFLVGWLAVVGLFARLALWNAAPSRQEMAELSGHLAAALDARADAATGS